LVTRGVISARHDFFHKAFGESTEEFLEILSMPDDYIIHRARHEDNGAEQWRVVFRSLTGEERAQLLETLSLGREGVLQARQNMELSPRLSTILAHYVQDT